jgi:endoglucanase
MSLQPRMIDWQSKIFIAAVGLWLLTVLISPIQLNAADPAPEEPPKPLLRMNSLGFLPTASKQVTITEGNRPYQVVRLSDKQVVLKGTSSKAKLNKDTGENVGTIDVSSLQQPGQYRLEAGSEAVDFLIADDAFNQAFYTVVRAMYLTRCGMEVSDDHQGKTYTHEGCHLHDAETDLVATTNTEHDATGGWHDAGDYNKYVVNAGVTVGMMLQAWDHYRDRLQSLKLNIPETDNSIPDYLDEIRWEIDWVLKTQLPDGSVSHKVTTKNFGGFVAPEKEDTPRFLTPWGSAATADFVAMTAGMSRAMKKYDGQYAAKCLGAARKSHEFLRAHPENHRADQKGFTTGRYDTDDGDDRLWAVAELWGATGEKSYLSELEHKIKQRIDEIDSDETIVELSWDWGNVQNLGLFTYAFSEQPNRDPQLVARIQHDIIKVADRIVATARSHGYCRPLGDRYDWGCNGTVARLAVVLELADQLQPHAKYRNARVAIVDHLFGRNYYGRSFVTGLGANPPQFPHDRRNGINGFAEPWPGYLVGGAWPTATDWHDKQEDYRTNEIAINWNGALIYALAAFVEPDTFPTVNMSGH